MAAKKGDYVALVNEEDEDIPNSQLDDRMKPRKWREIETFALMFLVFAVVLVNFLLTSTLYVEFKTYFVLQFMSQNSPIGFIKMTFYLAAEVGTVMMVVRYINMDNHFLVSNKTWLSFLNVIGMGFGFASFWGVLYLASMDFSTLVTEPEKWDSAIYLPLATAMLSLYFSGGFYICLQLLLSLLASDLDKNKIALRCIIYILCVTCFIISTIYRVQILPTKDLLYVGSDVALYRENGFEKDDLVALMVWLTGYFVWLFFVAFEDDVFKREPLPSKNSGHLKDEYTLLV